MTGNHTDPVRLLQDLIRIPSINPPGDEAACAELCAEILTGIGFDVTTHGFGERRVNLVARPPGKQPGNNLGFSGHLDTVPLGGGTWTHPPFSGEIADGRIYGRGSSDMKGGIAAFIAACARHHAETGTCPDVTIILTGGEETGCEGASALISDSLLAGCTFIGLLIGESTRNYPVLGHKGVAWFECTAEGRTAHAAMPEFGVNAIYHATDAITRIRAADLGEDDPILGKTTVCIGTFHGGMNINSVPDRASFTVDARTSSPATHSRIGGTIRTCLCDALSLQTRLNIPPVVAPPDNPFVQAVRTVATRHGIPDRGVVTVPYFTDAAILSPAFGNAPAVIIGPGEPDIAHQTDEYCPVDSLLTATHLYRDCIEFFSACPGIPG
ncbi:M20/M25/M40 family metallo-hydrolase [Acetobacter musti]|uniref:M20/M25/M40 family metallo-hydrolase n=1 Tax=Acetobacter musti TaxID=864732 RepID=A0ABX0JIB5_9PROT|nr:M20 family metallopeptidase [Acetobacter musti]NHN83246.1 M20/M25/M40 family metallo-hydrolase [Acetobacter musti]